MFAPHLLEEEDDVTIYLHGVSNVARAVKTILNQSIPGKWKSKNIDIFKGENKSEEYLKINQMGQVPAISFNGHTMNESNAIMRFLCQNYKLNNLYPTDLAHRHRVDTLMDLQGNMVRPQLLGAARKLAFGQIFSGNKPSYEFWNSTLAEIKPKLE